MIGNIDFWQNEILSTGFNKIIDGDEFKLSIHAECDAIANCSWEGISTENSILYCNLQPCSDCAKQGPRKHLYHMFQCNKAVKAIVDS